VIHTRNSLKKEYYRSTARHSKTGQISRGALAKYRQLISDVDVKQHTLDQVLKSVQTIGAIAAAQQDSKTAIRAQEIKAQVLLRIAEMSWREHEHDHPALSIQQVTHKGLPELPTKIEIVCISPTSK
jgi:hypothetical protein